MNVASRAFDSVRQKTKDFLNDPADHLKMGGAKALHWLERHPHTTGYTATALAAAATAYSGLAAKAQPMMDVFNQAVGAPDNGLTFTVGLLGLAATHIGYSFTRPVLAGALNQMAKSDPRMAEAKDKFGDSQGRKSGTHSRAALRPGLSGGPGGMG